MIRDRIKLGKAVGWDGIPPDLFKYSDTKGCSGCVVWTGGAGRHDVGSYEKHHEEWQMTRDVVQLPAGERAGSVFQTDFDYI